MLVRLLAFVLIPCAIAGGQQLGCGGLRLYTVSRSESGAPNAWSVFLQNRSNIPIRVQLSPVGFRWVVEGLTDGKWSVVLSGGIGPGKPSVGAAEGRAQDASRILGSLQKLFLDQFDLSQELPEVQDFVPGAPYRITFEQDVEVLTSNLSAKCKLRAKPRPFRYKPRKVKVPGGASIRSSAPASGCRK